MQGYIFPYISGRSSPNKYINKAFWGGSGQDKSIPNFRGGGLNSALHGTTVPLGKTNYGTLLGFFRQNFVCGLSNVFRQRHKAR